jgi:FAD:protein FMN transferase
MRASGIEASVAFPCFGGTAAAWLAGEGDLDRALDEVRRLLQGWHRRFTRFEPTSELSRLNADPSRRVRVSDVLCRFAAAAVDAARATDGLVDPTLVAEIQAADYAGDLPASPPLDASLAPPRRPAQPSPHGRWREIAVDGRSRTVTRPAGVELDSGGIAKGLCADILAERLSDFDAFAIDCGGDLRIGGCSRRRRTVCVDDPLGGGCIHEFELAAGGVATSGIGRRSWLDSEGGPAHHLLDPSTGRPAFTGILQATALAPTAVEAETLAKAALLSGPEGAGRWLSYGGLLVFDDGSHIVLEPPPRRGLNVEESCTSPPSGARRYSRGAIPAPPARAPAPPRASHALPTPARACRSAPRPSAAGAC